MIADFAFRASFSLFRRASFSLVVGKYDAGSQGKGKGKCFPMKQHQAWFIWPCVSLTVNNPEIETRKKHTGRQTRFGKNYKLISFHVSLTTSCRFSATQTFSQKLSNFTHFDTWNAMKRKTQRKSGLKKEEVNNSGSQGIAWLDGPFTALKMMLCRFRITIHIKLTLHNSSQFGWISLGFNHKVELSFSANTQASWARLGRGKPESTRSAGWNQAQERRKRDLEARKRVLQEKFSFGKYYYR